MLAGWPAATQRGLASGDNSTVIKWRRGTSVASWCSGAVPLREHGRRHKRKGRLAASMLNVRRREMKVFSVT